MRVNGATGQAVKVGAVQSPVPLTAKSYVPSSQSLLLTLMVAFCTPEAVGLKVTAKVAEPPAAMEPAGISVPTVNSAFAGEGILLIFSAAVPVF